MSYLSAQIAQLIQCSKAQESLEPYHEVLEKITLTGVEYFDLGYKVSDFEIGDTIRFEGIVKGTEASSISSSGSQLMLSIGNDGGQWLGKAQNGTKYAFGSSNVSTISFNEEVLADVTIALSGSASRPTFTISGSVTSDTATSTITQRSATPTYYDFPLLFGAGTKSTGEKSYGGDYTFKCGKIYINGTMTKDYIPVLDSQMRPCLYDKISKTFTYAKKISDGTDATSTLTYKRWNKFDVDYIESSGTQCINTGIKTSSTISFELKTAFPRAQFMLGGRSEASHSGIAFGGAAVSDKITVRYDFGGRVEGNVAVGSKVIVVTSNGKTLNYTVDENTYSVTVASSSAVVGSNDIYLFGINTAGTVTYGQGTINYCKLFDNGTLVRDYKPTVWHNGNTTAVACLYDEVYNKMYTNAGTGSFKAYIVGADSTVYEVGMYLKTLKSGNSSTTGPIIELGEYPQDGIGYHIKTTTDSTSSNYLFGSRITTGAKMQITTLSGSQTGGTILSTVMGESITWKSGTTTWARSSNGTTYECSLQTYKDGNTYKYNAIGYNYTLGQEADKQTATYSSSIDRQQDAPMLLLGAFNTDNILFGNNHYFFVEWNLPDVRHTLLPVINSTHTKICFIDNKTKQTYEFIKIGGYTPATDNITFKQLDGTIITGTLT